MGSVLSSSGMREAGLHHEAYDLLLTDTYQLLQIRTELEGTRLHQLKERVRASDVSCHGGSGLLPVLWSAGYNRHWWHLSRGAVSIAALLLHKMIPHMRLLRLG